MDFPTIPLVDLGAQQEEIADEVEIGMKEVFAQTSFIGGPAVTEFEKAYAGFLGARHCVGVGNGTDAIELALRSCGVRSGGEVIVPANTFIATAEAVSRIGATPVPVDVDPVHLLIDPARAAEAAGPRTQAIVPVHLFGQTAPVERLESLAASYGAAIVEDAAQSQGATRHGRFAGTLARAAGTSFYPGKNLGAAGDAGAVTTDDPEVAARVRLLGAHGSRVRYQHEAIGLNSRLDTLQAVVLSAKLRRLRGWNQRRREAAERYTSLLSGLPGVQLPVSAEGNVDVWHLYVIRTDDRDRVLHELQAAGIGAGIHYPVPFHLSQAYRELDYRRGDFPVAERAADTMLSLPIYPHITVEQQEYVARTLSTAIVGRSR
ncbi:DegT/DnrJ/EryC1/StrS family aminotransferase [Arthrobacter sp. NPDC080031]|uniref:DegT/DnrJ/EryC1/StrS family aminotransferase n=1 Tax=Arthrobacter sp. NPDC080031 TaxID=3155918 RepID=UPI00344F40C1